MAPARAVATFLGGVALRAELGRDERIGDVAGRAGAGRSRGTVGVAAPPKACSTGWAAAAGAEGSGFFLPPCNLCGPLASTAPCAAVRQRYAGVNAAASDARWQAKCAAGGVDDRSFRLAV
eukprot:scaffold80721_cov59-Phaeocystis_antarctica.AAC.6